MVSLLKLLLRAVIAGMIFEKGGCRWSKLSYHCVGRFSIAFLPELSQVSHFHRTGVLKFFEFDAGFFFGWTLLSETKPRGIEFTCSCFCRFSWCITHNLAGEKSALHRGQCPAGHFSNKKKVELKCWQEDRHLIFLLHWFEKELWVNSTGGNILAWAEQF